MAFCSLDMKDVQGSGFFKCVEVQMTELLWKPSQTLDSFSFVFETVDLMSLMYYRKNQDRRIKVEMVHLHL